MAIFKYNLLEPITYENLNTLEPGDWIWDDKKVERIAHKRQLGDERIVESVGFRLIHILDLKDFPSYSSKPFSLSTIDSYGYEWTYFELNRFYKIKGA